MVLAVASGKGGTGKTSVSTALAQALAEDGAVRLLDCDVEEPNARFFFPEISLKTFSVTVPVPKVDPSACTACGACSRFCRFGALATVGAGTLVFPDLCHHCGGCSLVCPAGAITEEPFPVGVKESGKEGNLAFVQGVLDVGQSMSTPLIRSVREEAGGGEVLTILDCPPGTACPMVTAVRGVDHTLLVTEPTAFGLHDLKLAVQTVRALDQGFSVVVNRAVSEDTRVQEWCRDQGIPVILEIPEDRRVAEAYSRGQTLLRALPDLAPELRALVRGLSK